MVLNAGDIPIINIFRDSVKGKNSFTAAETEISSRKIINKSLKEGKVF